MIFNEILELKFWGIEKNLNKNIEKRINTEMKIENLTFDEGEDEGDSDVAAINGDENSRKDSN